MGDYYNFNDVKPDVGWDHDGEFPYDANFQYQLQQQPNSHHSKHREGVFNQDRLSPYTAVQLLFTPQDTPFHDYTSYEHFTTNSPATVSQNAVAPHIDVYPPTGLKDNATKRKLSNPDGKKLKKENIRPPKPVRQSSTPSLIKRKIRPLLEKSYSYNLDVQEPTPPSTSLEMSKKKPNFYLNLDHLKNPSVQSFESNHSDSFNSTYPPVSHAGVLDLYDNDLNFDADLDTLTPSMKPPGTTNHDYFDEFVIPSNFDHGNNHITASHDNELHDNNDPDEHFLGLYTNFEDNYDYDNNVDSNIDNNDQNFTFAELQIDKSPISHQSASSGGKLPQLYKTTSNHSNNSATSLTEVKDKKTKKPTKGSHCMICGKYISRDLSRHLRIHDKNGRFRCVYPDMCGHRTKKFNRPYDYKKHLLHSHFQFDDPHGKTVNNLTNKLPLLGCCKACMFRCNAQDWLEKHVLTDNPAYKCQYVVVHPVAATDGDYKDFKDDGDMPSEPN